MQFSSLIPVLGSLAYLAAGLLLALGFVNARPRLRAVAVALAVLGGAAHALLLWQSLRVGGGLNLNMLDVLSLTAWMIVLVLLLSWLRHGPAETGIVVFPGAAVCLLLMALVPAEPLILAELTPALRLHVYSSLIAYSLLSIAALNALLLAVQDSLLRHPKRIRQLEMLPPLNSLETLLFRLVAAGWLVLTLSLITGFMFVDNLFAQHLVHKTALSVLSWLLFALLLAGRWWFGWRGRRAIRFTLAAMFVLVLAYFGSKLVLEVLLDRSWSQPTPTAAMAEAIRTPR
ncbi:cytochrome C assembly family protein [Wenzhouxiangella marina]|uniref:ABC-type uncharacterized transport system, permease component n=1 Tax=Wenzhouxiangella marina TaxID=1579979 RepID=A0A0K0XXU5_9GAMM|nr:cytochrome c biogenesis protein CcsA [Wenzhouxiangella marina]AKS42431.1 ABC-type uncharacterized transport system, permease component [Wenzhouxiangella marina]MBB6085795.1 ABC-type uncharacterized transport system permease subunit [Wenzhouxiangella marina]